jgi:hypothetical protein
VTADLTLMTAGDGDVFARGDALALGAVDADEDEETASAAGLAVGCLLMSLIITTMTTSTAAVQTASSDSMILARRWRLRCRLARS